MKLIILFIALLLFSACTNKEPRVITEYKSVCIKQEDYPYGKTIKVRVHPEDLELHKSRTIYLKKGYEFYKDQVKRNNDCLKKNELPP